MAVRTFLAAIALMFLSSCLSIDGRYRPACIAYEGDEIEFSESRFVWRRFTDELKVDENGELIEPFPDFPKTGTYSVEGSTLQLNTEDENSPTIFFPHEDEGHMYLMTAAENEKFLQGGKMPECVLRRAD